MEGLFSLDRWLAWLRPAYDWVLTNALVIDNEIQVLLIALGFAVAAFSARRLRSQLDKLRKHGSFGRGAHLLAPLLLPALSLVALWLIISAAVATSRPYGLASTAATLVGAWIAIHLASQFVKNPI